MEYNVSDMKYYKEKCDAIARVNDRHPNTCRYYIFEDEVKLSEKEKIDFIDNYYLLRGNKGGATYMLNLMDKYNAEKDSLKKDSWGYVKTNSLKAWLKRNDPWGIVDNHYRYGNYSFGGHEYADFGSKTPRPIWGSSESTPYYDEDGRIVDLWFHDVLNEKWNLEMKYFYDHDTKTQKAKQIKELCNKYGDFGIEMFAIVGWNGASALDREWCKTFNHRMPSETELDKMLEVYSEVDKLMTSKADEIRKRLDWELLKDD